jgi:exoribonuclease R
MPSPYIHCQDPALFEQGFAAIRTELEVPEGFPNSVEIALQQEWVDPYVERIDLSHLPFISIDPLGSRDLDQAFYAEQSRSGYIVRYAIADVAAFVSAGGEIDKESRVRGLTLYAPDRQTPLHPTQMSEGRASLLEGAVRPSIVWTLTLAQDGAVTDARAERSLIRNTEMLSYAQAQERLDGETANEVLSLVREIGLLREELERARNAVSLNLPSQELSKTNVGYELAYDTVFAIEGWNAQISLMTGMAAADLMLEGKVGLLRTLPVPDEQTISKLRRHSRALSVTFEDAMSYADWVRTLDPQIRRHVALLSQAAQGLRGAGYIGFAGAVPGDAGHSAIAAHYTHVTAPLRRLVDRFALEVCVALTADRPVPGWVVDSLDELPDIMKSAKRKERTYTRALLDFAEALVLTDSVGQTFDAIVTSLSSRGVTLQITEPAVITRISAEGMNLGQQLSVQLKGVDIDRRTLDFEVIA